MAEQTEEDGIHLEKNNKILVNVENALEDIIIVSFTHQGKVFQGALLNSSKKGLLPCGIIPPKDFLEPPPPRPEEPPLSPSGLGQRFTYFQDKGPGGKSPLIQIKRTIRPPARYRKPNSKMTVRLRPRQVLCSKCKSICTENSQSVNGTSRSTRTSTERNKNSSESGTERSKNKHPPESACDSEGSKNSDQLDDEENKKLVVSSGSEETNSKKLNKIKIVGNYWISPTREPPEEPESVENENSDLADEKERMVLRKKRSVGSMEDLWDESVFEDSLKKAKIENCEPPRTTTPVIKISFGTSGQGTVLKIPAKIQTPDCSEENSENKYVSSSDLMGNKAAKKALKKAKKETRRKMFGSPNQSPTSNLELPRRHKHKVKHRKKHKESKYREEMPERWNVAKNDKDYSAIKEQCLKQRLSISLKRLNANAYMRCDPSQEDSTPSNSPDSSSPDCNDEVPDFPPSGLAERNCPESSTLMMRISTQSVQTCITTDGRKMSVGDVVWGKIHGFPWWPGKVLNISVSRKDDGVVLAPQAHVAWYASSTSSLMPCDQLCPFLETFKTRHNKKKRGPYKEAIKLAINEAQLSADSSPPQQQILSVTSSPREVNVLS